MSLIDLFKTYNHFTYVWTEGEEKGAASQQVAFEVIVSVLRGVSYKPISILM